MARDCLSPAEKTIYEGFRFEARQKSWLAGRFTAKHLVSQVHHAAYRPDQITIRNNDLGAPCAYYADQPLPGCLSISHSGDWAAAAFTPQRLRVGIDLEKITHRSDAFIQDYFTEQEVIMVSSALTGSPPGTPRSAEQATLIWSAKEALLKGLGIGLRLDTRQVEVIAIEDEEDREGWKRLEIRSAQVKESLAAYWRSIDGYLLTLVALMDVANTIDLLQVNCTGS